MKTDMLCANFTAKSDFQMSRFRIYGAARETGAINWSNWPFNPKRSIFGAQNGLFRAFGKGVPDKGFRIRRFKSKFLRMFFIGSASEKGRTWEHGSGAWEHWHIPLETPFLKLVMLKGSWWLVSLEDLLFPKRQKSLNRTHYFYSAKRLNFAPAGPPKKALFPG